MYLSHPVRRMCEDPIAGETAVLIVIAEDDQQRGELEQAIEELGGTVTDRLQFGALRVDVAQKRIDDICELDGIESIETEHAVGVGGDAGEDV
jgi:diphthamide synthase (EF-2-diphthine--ammonia ligase)